MLNANLNKSKLKKAYKKDNRLRIENFLQPEVAGRIQQAFMKHIPFNVNYVVNGQYTSTGQAEMAAKTDQQKQVLNKQVHAAASQGEGFLYCGYRMKQAKPTENAEVAFLHDVFEYFNGDEMLSFIRDITGITEVSHADGQYTRFSPGQFLTRHRDVVENENRRLAYVLGFTHPWHPDWGGLLQFYKADGTPRDAWMPQFNTLSLFDTEHVHGVSYVTPYAKAPRISLTGWFKSPITKQHA